MPRTAFLLLVSLVALPTATVHAQASGDLDNRGLQLSPEVDSTSELRRAKRRRRGAAAGVAFSTYGFYAGVHLLAGGFAGLGDPGGNRAATASFLAGGGVTTALGLTGLILAGRGVRRQSNRIDAIVGRTPDDKGQLRRSRFGLGFGTVLFGGGIAAMFASAFAANFCISFTEEDCSGTGHTPSTRAALYLGLGAMVGGAAWFGVALHRRRRVNERYRLKPFPSDDGDITLRVWPTPPAPPARPAMVRF